MDSSTNVTLSVIVPSFNAFNSTARTVHALLNQQLPKCCKLEIIVVDDASIDRSAERLINEFGNRMKLIRHTQNLGRSAARNAGARAATGQWLLMLDCDCTPSSTNYLVRIMEGMDSNRIHIGEVRFDGCDFWSIYRRLGASRRLQQHRKGNPEALSTANMLLDRHVFAQSGGYDEEYRRYGFEDRDLLLRLSDSGILIHYSGTACVIHSDPANLGSLMTKNLEAARYTAEKFRTRHPHAYNRLGYAQLDFTLHPVRSCLGAIVGCVLYPAAGLGDWILSRKSSSSYFRAALARIFLASAYCRGSVMANVSLFRR